MKGSLSTYLADTAQVGCPISTKKLTMTQEFLTTAEELYTALTDQQVNKLQMPRVTWKVLDKKVSFIHWPFLKELKK